MRVYLDANFFISGFSDRPKDVYIIKDAAEKAGMELRITRQVFQELRWYLRREVEQMIQIEETLSKDIKELMESIKKPEGALPQLNDMSLILAAMRSKKSKIVTSDLKLLNTIQDIKIDVEGIVGSAFALELMESIDDDELKKSLSVIRERIYGEEVRYSIARQEAYDPVTRIRLIGARVACDSDCEGPCRESRQKTLQRTTTLCSRLPRGHQGGYSNDV
jgi:rRNA-processing protein FCF1